MFEGLTVGYVAFWASIGFVYCSLRILNEPKRSTRRR